MYIYNIRSKWSGHWLFVMYIKSGIKKLLRKKSFKKKNSEKKKKKSKGKKLWKRNFKEYY